MKSFPSPAGLITLICRCRRGCGMRTRFSWQNRVRSMIALLQHSIPAVTARELQVQILERRPFLKEDLSWVLAAKEGAEGVFEGPSEQHRSPVVFLLPSLEIAVTVLSWAGEVLADLACSCSSSRRLRAARLRGHCGG